MRPLPENSGQAIFSLCTYDMKAEAVSIISYDVLDIMKLHMISIDFDYL
jgi:hypothetical protein